MLNHLFKLLYVICGRNCPATKYQVHTESCISGKIKLNSHQWLDEHFSTGLCINAKYTIQIIEKLQGMVELVIALSTLVKHYLRERKKQQECLTLYPYSLNGKMDIFADDKNMTRSKKMMVLQGSYFVACLDYLKVMKHVDITISILNYKQFNSF